MTFFRINKAISLADELLRIRLCNIQSNLKKVTIVGRFEDRNGRLLSHGHYYKAESSNEIDLLHARSVGGSYLGVEPMGLLWSLSPVIDDGKIYLTYRNSAEKYKYHLQVRKRKTILSKNLAYAGHINPLIHQPESDLLCESSFQRTFLSECVERRVIQEDGIQGVLFTPKNYKKCPGIVDIRGGTGGQQEFRAALLANKGFCVLQLAYFGVPGLPESLFELTDLSYFENGVDWLLKQERVHQSGVGILGLCRGGEMSLLLTCLLAESKIRATCLISCMTYMNGPDMKYKDENISKHGYDFHACEHTPRGYSYRKTYADKIDVTQIHPVERIRVPLLFIYGGDDHLIAEEFFQLLAERMEQAGNSHLLTMRRYEGAGHMIEPPFLPAMIKVDSWVYNKVVVLGGFPLEHSRAQLKAWLRIQEFFSRNLEPAVGA